MKRILSAIAVVVALLFVAGIMLHAQTAPSNPLVLKGKNPMGNVKFDHKAHIAAGAKCTDCHHAAKAGKTPKAAQEKCSDCHSETPAAPMKTNFKSAFHDTLAKKGTCIDCHVKSVAAGKKAPAKCADCHKKENG